MLRTRFLTQGHELILLQIAFVLMSVKLLLIIYVVNYNYFTNFINKNMYISVIPREELYYIYNYTVTTLNTLLFLRSEVLTAANMEMKASWDMT
jgi:hypothetical protein